MKKTLSFVLVLALVLSSFSMAFAGTTTTTAAATTTAKTTTVPKDVVGTSYEAPVTVLTALGVVNGYQDGTYKPSANVTRAEFAKLIIAELGLDANAQAAKSTFTDMAGSAWADGYVGYAASLGIINGYGNGKFGPTDNVTYDQALTMIVRALGYTSDCKEMNGTWPAIYVQKARVLGITDDVKAGGAVAANRGDVATYLYNALTCNMGYADDKGVFQNKLDKDGKEIKVATNLDAKETTDYKVITKSDADNSVVNIRQYVGAYAKYFTLTKGPHEDDIIAVSDVKSTFVTGEYKVGDKVIQAADGTEYKLDDIFSKGIKGTSTNIDNKFTATEFVNGDTAVAGSTILNTDDLTLNTALNGTAGSADGTIVTLAADLSGKTIKGIYSVSKWKIKTDDVVSADDIATIKNNKSLLGKKFTLDDNSAIDATSFELVGVTSLDDIKAGNVVYVYSSGSDDEITRVAVGTEEVTGTITAIKESGSNAKATINGKDYKFAKQKLQYNGTGSTFDPSDVDTDDQIKASVDAYGYLYDYDLTAGGADNYAVVLEYSDGVTGAIGTNKHQIKLFLADGTDKVFNVDDDLFKSSGAVAGFTSTSGLWVTGPAAGLTTGAIIKYGLDKNGILDSIEKMKPYELVKSTDYVVNATTANPTGAKSDITKSGYFNNKEIRKDAVIFSSDKTSDKITTDEDDYSVSTLDKVLDSKDVHATYVLYKDKIAAMILYDFSGKDETYGVITAAQKSNGTSDYQADVLVNGNKVTYGIASESVYNIAKSSEAQDAVKNAGITSVYKLGFNASGEINKLTPAWTDTTVSPTNGDTYATAVAVVGATPASFSNNTFKGATITQTIGSQLPSSPAEVTVANDAVVYINDGTDFKVGTLSDLKTLNETATVYFYDTKDDKNDGLMTLIYIWNPEKDKPVAGPGSITTTTANYTLSSGSAIGTLTVPVANTPVSVLNANGTALTASTDYVIAGNNVMFTATGLQKIVNAANGTSTTITVVSSNGNTTVLTFATVLPTITTSAAITSVSASAITTAAIATVNVGTTANAGLASNPVSIQSATGMTASDLVVTKASTGVYNITVKSTATASAGPVSITIRVTDAWGATKDVVVNLTLL